MITSPKHVSVEIYTTSHRVLGRLNPGPSGLFSYLNIRTTSSVEIEGAHLTRLHQPAKMVARYPQLWLVKREIVAVLLSSRVEMGPATITRGGFTTSVPHSVHILLGGYELHGQIESPGKLNLASLLFEGDRMFIPVYSAELTAILFPSIRAESPAALFNRDMVDGMALLSRGDTAPLAPPMAPWTPSEPQQAPE